MTKSTLFRDNLGTHAMLLATAIIWGLAFVFIKIAERELPVLTLVMLRISLASFTFLLFLGVRHRNVPRIARRHWPGLVGLSLTGVVTYNVLINLGLAYIPAGTTSLVNSSGPVISLLLSCILLGEVLTRYKAVGISMALAGVVLVTLKGSGDTELGFTHILGTLALIGALLSWSSYSVFSKPLTKHYPATFLTSFILVVGGAAIQPLWATVDISPILHMSWMGWFSVLFLALASTVAGQVMWTYGLSRLDVSQVTVYLYLLPVSALVSANLLLGETVTLYLLLGGALIIGGVALTNRNTLARNGGMRLRSEMPTPEQSR